MRPQTCCLKLADPPMITAKQLRLGRNVLEMSQREFADAAEVSEQTIQRLEKMSGELQGLISTLRKIEKALEDRGVIFIEGGAILKRKED